MAFPTKAEQDRKSLAAEYEAACARGLDEVYRAYPIIPRSIANDQMICEVCDTFLGVQPNEVAPTLAVFRSAVEAEPGLLGGGDGVSVESVARQKQKLLNEIEQLLAEVMSTFDRKIELNKLAYWSLEELRARRDQIKERQRLQKLSSVAIRDELKERRPKQHPYFPYDLLEEKVTASEVKAALRSAFSDVWMRRFGSQQLNDRLAGRS